MLTPSEELHLAECAANCAKAMSVGDRANADHWRRCAGNMGLGEKFVYFNTIYRNWFQARPSLIPR